MEVDLDPTLQMRARGQGVGFPLHNSLVELYFTCHATQWW